MNSTFNKQAKASLEKLDEETVEVAQECLAKMGIQPTTVNSGSITAGLQGTSGLTFMGPTLTPQPQTQPQAPATRKTRSDKGTHKPKAPADPDEIVLRLTLTEARMVALGDPDFGISAKIQDQIIAQLQKRLDALQKQK